MSRFDFQQVGRDLPQVDLGDLERFFTLAVGRHRRRIFKRDDGIEVKAPDAWQSRSYAVRDHYDGLVFDRNLSGVNSAARVLGVGHTLFDVALEEALNLSVRVAMVGEAIKTPVLIVSVEDEVTRHWIARSPSDLRCTGGRRRTIEHARLGVVTTSKPCFIEEPRHDTGHRAARNGSRRNRAAVA